MPPIIPLLSELPHRTSDPIKSGTYSLFINYVEPFRNAFGRVSLRLSIFIRDTDAKKHNGLHSWIYPYVALEGRDQFNTPLICLLEFALPASRLYVRATEVDATLVDYAALKKIVEELSNADICARLTPAPSPDMPPSIEYLVTESTYKARVRTGTHRKVDQQARLISEVELRARVAEMKRAAFEMGPPEPIDRYAWHREQLEARGIERPGLPPPVLTLYGPIDHPDYA